MDTLLLHPKLVHLPIALAVLMPPITLGLALAIWRGVLPLRVWVLPIALQLVLLASGGLALATGEVDEEVAENVVPESVIEAHEEAAETFLWFGAAAFFLLLGPLVLRRKSSFQEASLVAATLATLGVLAAGVDVGAKGGDLVYKHQAASAFQPVAAGSDIFTEATGQKVLGQDEDSDSD